jgi:hypothetical protein
MGTQEHVYDMQAGAHRSKQEPFVLFCPQPPGACCGGGVTVLTSSHAGTCPVVRRNRGPHLGVGRVGASLDKLGQSSV